MGNTELTPKQLELWKIADKKCHEIGGIGRITRNPNKSIRDAWQVEGTQEWALLEASRLASPVFDAKFTDVFCEKLITLINGWK